MIMKVKVDLVQISNELFLVSNPIPSSLPCKKVDSTQYDLDIENICNPACAFIKISYMHDN